MNSAVFPCACCGESNRGRPQQQPSPPEHGGISDFWVAEINSTGTAIPWPLEIGGSDDDEVYGLAVDSSNKLYLTGYAASEDFPTTNGALVQPGIARAFVIKLDPARSPTSSMVYSSLAGNPGNTRNELLSGSAIAADSSGNTYVGAWTYNLGLFTSPNAFQRSAATGRTDTFSNSIFPAAPSSTAHTSAEAATISSGPWASTTQAILMSQVRLSPGISPPPLTETWRSTTMNSLFTQS